MQLRYDIDVRDPYLSWLPFLIQFFSTFRDGFRRIEMRPRSRRVAFPPLFCCWAADSHLSRSPPCIQWGCVLLCRLQLTLYVYFSRLMYFVLPENVFILFKRNFGAFYGFEVMFPLLALSSWNFLHWKCISLFLNAVFREAGRHMTSCLCRTG